MKIRKGDTVKVIAGRDKGKTGRVLEVQKDNDRLLVEGVMMVKRHTKANPAKQIKGGIAEKESAIHVSNVMVVTSDGKASRVGYKLEGEGASARKVRIARKTGEVLAAKS
ncbi:MAG: 50S ribosomal protein L24 [Bryobacterales bacterium]|nr:50S ribosomal protein L24 [Bryobacterales bacterium]